MFGFIQSSIHSSIHIEHLLHKRHWLWSWGYKNIADSIPAFQPHGPVEVTAIPINNQYKGLRAIMKAKIRVNESIKVGANDYLQKGDQEVFTEWLKFKMSIRE